MSCNFLKYLNSLQKRKVTFQINMDHKHTKNLLDLFLKENVAYQLKNFKYLLLPFNCLSLGKNIKYDQC